MTDEIYIPQHSIDAEQSVLGALMLKPDSWDNISDILTERDFYRIEHQLVFRHISKLIESGDRVDILTVGESLERTGKLEKLGGLQYLGDIVSNTPSAANIKQYAKIVHEHRLNRDLMAAAYDIQELVKSPDDASAKIEKATDILNGLVEVEQKQTETLSEATANALELIEARYASPNTIMGLKTGFDEFDAMTCGLQNGDLIILAGRPSMGKTALAVNIGENVAISQKLSVLMFELEMSAPQLAIRSIGSIGKINIQRLRSGRLADDDWPRITQAGAKINDAPFFIDTTARISTAQIKSRSRKIMRKHGLALVIIDYLQLMEGTTDNRNNDLSAITRSLKLMAKELNVPVIMLSQLNRQVESRTDKRPIMSDLRDSGAIEQDADVIAMLYRDEVYNEDTLNKGEAELLIRKQRMGPIGTIRLSFNGEYSCFSNFSGVHVNHQPKARRGFQDGKSKASGDSQ